MIPRLPKGASKIVRKTAFTIEAKGKINCPVLTGALRNSIQTRVETDEKATIGTPLEYAPYVHDGTSRMEGRPFLTQAADEEKKNFQNDLRNLERSLK
jgi:HK97 gp10 family phage protein